jgi:hypothetical protein
LAFQNEQREQGSEEAFRLAQAKMEDQAHRQGYLDLVVGVPNLSAGPSPELATRVLRPRMIEQFARGKALRL